MSQSKVGTCRKYVVPKLIAALPSVLCGAFKGEL